MASISSSKSQPNAEHLSGSSRHKNNRESSILPNGKSPFINEYLEQSIRFDSSEYKQRIKFFSCNIRGTFDVLHCLVTQIF